MLPAAVAITSCVLLSRFLRVVVRTYFVVIHECQEMSVIDKRSCVALADLLAGPHCTAHCMKRRVLRCYKKIKTIFFFWKFLQKICLDFSIFILLTMIPGHS